MTVTKTDHLDTAYADIVAAAGLGAYKAAQKSRDKMDKGFKNGHDALGRPWTPLALSTIRQKGHSTILVESGTMAGSTFAKRTGLLTATVGVADPKVNFHEFGGPTLPRRPVIEPARIDLKQNIMKEAVADEIATAITKFRFARYVDW